VPDLRAEGSVHEGTATPHHALGTRARCRCLQARLDKNPDAMRTRRETVEHPFGTLKMRMGATHFSMKTLPKVATEMALHVLAYNLTRVMNIFGIKPFLAAIRA
jgi:DDE family transposase